MGKKGYIKTKINIFEQLGPWKNVSSWKTIYGNIFVLIFYQYDGNRPTLHKNIPHVNFPKKYKISKQLFFWSWNIKHFSFFFCHKKACYLCFITTEKTNWKMAIYLNERVRFFIFYQFWFCYGEFLFILIITIKLKKNNSYF